MNARKNRLSVASDVSDVEDYDVERVLQLLADEETRTLFQQLSSPKTTRELISECDIARSTAYRKITELENAGLLIEVDHVDDSEQPTAYVRPLEEIVLRVGDTLTIDQKLELDHKTVERIDVLLDNVEEALNDSQLAVELQAVRQLIATRERSIYIERLNG